VRFTDFLRMTVLLSAGAATALAAVPRKQGNNGDDGTEGAVQGSIVGTYLHGLFASGPLRRSLLCFLARLRGRPADPRWGAPGADGYERLADIVGGALDMEAIAKLAELSFPRA